MDFKLYGPLSAAVILLVVFNGLLSKDVHDWVPSASKRIVLHALIWLLPVLGFFLANWIGELRWFRNLGSKGGSAIGGGFLQLDSVFNPGAKHQLEIVEKQKAQIHHTHEQTRDDGDKEDT